MTAREWYNNQLSKQSGKIMNGYAIAEEYSTYLLQHHLKQFAYECKEKCIWLIDEKAVKIEDIDQTLTDYLTKNNI